MNINIQVPVFSNDDDEDDEIETMFAELGRELELSDTIPPMSWKEAYEANKTRNNCILCGQTTIDTPLLTSIIKTCSCVTELAEKG